MATTGIERRIERLEKELGMTGEKVLVRIQRFGLGDGELIRFRTGDAVIDRLPGESEAGFELRAGGEAMRMTDTPYAVLIEVARGAWPT